MITCRGQQFIQAVSADSYLAAANVTDHVRVILTITLSSASQCHLTHITATQFPLFSLFLLLCGMASCVAVH